MKKDFLQGTKKIMTQLFKNDGTVTPVTIVVIDQSHATLLEHIKEGSKIKVSGISKGKGFAGGIKRYSFASQPKTHGQSDRERAIGSIGGGTDPGKVWKGKKMPGRMGGAKITVSGLRVVEIDVSKRLMYISGAVPGGPNSKVEISIVDARSNNE